MADEFLARRQEAAGHRPKGGAPWLALGAVGGVVGALFPPLGYRFLENGLCLGLFVTIGATVGGVVGLCCFAFGPKREGAAGLALLLGFVCGALAAMLSCAWLVDFARSLRDF